MASVELKQASKVYPNGFKAVHEIDLAIHDGEFVVFVGPSGCAKSTLLRMIAGLESISAGELYIDGQVVNHLTPKERGGAMVFQNYALYPHMRVRDNLGFGLKLAGMSKEAVNERVVEAARMLEIEALLDRYPRQLSGGQAQRVAVGRAIVKKPKVFLFDEPLSNLDAKLRASMRVRLTELHKELKAQGESSTAIYVTHDQVEAMTMGERICVLKEGRIQQFDTPDVLYNQPANTFVASFIGSPEMNLLPAQIKAGQLKVLGSQFPSDRPEAEISLGLRPEHVSLELGQPSGLQGTLSHVEYMGNELFAYATVGSTQLTSRLPADRADSLRTLPRGTPLSIRFDLPKAHFFDAITGQRL